MAGPTRYADIVSRLSIWGVDKAVRDLTKFQTGLVTCSTVAASIAKPMLLMGAGAAVGIGILTKKAATFETALVDMGKVTNESVDSIRKKIMELPPELGSAVEAVKGYYQVISAGVKDPKKSLETLTVSAKAAKAAHVAQSEVIKGLTKLMAGYEGEIKKVSDAADLLFTIEKEGQTTVAELIPVIGGLAKMSHDVGISQDEMGASLATITKTAGNTAEAATYYRMMLIALLKPSGEMKEALRSMGYESAQAAINAIGLTETLKGLKKWTGGSQEKLAALFGRLRGLLGMTALSSRNFEVLTDTIKEMEKKTGAADKAFQDWTKTLDAFWKTFQNTLGKAMIEMGTIFIPVVGDMIKKLTALVNKFNNLDESTKKVIARVTVLTAGIGLLGGSILLLTSIVSSLTLKITAAVVAVKALAVAAGAITAPIWAIVAAATAASIAIGKVTWEVGKLVKAKLEEKEAVKDAAEVLAKFNKDSKEHLAIIKKASKYTVEDIYGDPDKIRDVWRAISVLTVMALSHDKSAADIAKRQRDRMKALLAGYDEIKDKDTETASVMIDNAKKVAEAKEKAAEQERKAFDELMDYRRTLGLASLDEEIAHIRRKLLAGGLEAEEEVALTRQLYDLKAEKIETETEQKRKSAEQELKNIEERTAAEDLHYREKWRLQKRTAELEKIIAKNSEEAIKKKKEALAKEYGEAIKGGKTRKDILVKEERRKKPIPAFIRAEAREAPGLPAVTYEIKPTYNIPETDPRKLAKAVEDTVPDLIRRAKERENEHRIIVEKEIDRGNIQ